MSFQLFIDNLVLCGIFYERVALPEFAGQNRLRRYTDIASKGMDKPLGKRLIHTSDGVCGAIIESR
jgi:hypothetical protein